MAVPWPPVSTYTTGSISPSPRLPAQPALVNILRRDRRIEIRAAQYDADVDMGCAIFHGRIIHPCRAPEQRIIRTVAGNPQFGLYLPANLKFDEPLAWLRPPV